MANNAECAMAAIRALGWNVANGPNRFPLLLCTGVNRYVPKDGFCFDDKILELSKHGVKIDWNMYGWPMRFLETEYPNTPLTISQYNHVMHRFDSIQWFIQPKLNVTEMYTSAQKLDILNNMDSVDWKYDKDGCVSIYWKLIGHVRHKLSYVTK